MDIKRGDIWYIESGYSVGSEQRAGRPAIVVSNNRNNQYSGTVEVVYLTTQPKRDLPTHVTISSLSRESTALCEQITSVSTERFGSYRGAVTDEEMEAAKGTDLPDLLEHLGYSVRRAGELGGQRQHQRRRGGRFRHPQPISHGGWQRYDDPDSQP